MMLLYIKQGPGQDKRSPERDTYSCKRLYPWFSGMKLTEIGATEISGYIATRRTAGAAPATINREIGLLSAALNYAKLELGWTVAENPVAGRRLKTPQGRTRWLSYEQAQMLLDTVKANKRTDHIYDFILLALNTGMRSGEILGLEWERVSLQHQTIRLEATHTKNAKPRLIPMNNDARAAILSRARFRAANRPDSPWVFCNRYGQRIKSIKRGFASACKRAGISNFRVHDLRHTCGSWMVNAGVPLPEIRDLLGHSTVQMTEQYAHLAPENVTAAVRRIEGVSSHSGHSQNQTTRKDAVRY